MDLAERSATAVVTRHPWELARARAVVDILEQRHVSPRRILDVGTGDGFCGLRVAERFAAELTAFDPHLTPELIERFAKPGATFVRELPPSLDDYDLLLLLDVIEHVPNDAEFLRGLLSRRSHGSFHVLLTVPAFQSLFTDHDRFLEHHRRYTLRGLRQACQGARLNVVADGYLFSSLLLPRLMGKLTELVRAPRAEARGVGAWRGGSGVTRAVTAALTFDNELLLGLSRLGVKLPGLSAWALCEGTT